MASTPNFTRRFAYQPHSPIETLHHDVLDTIFVLYHDASKPSMTDPLTLASVCRGWRHTALTMHSLWSYIGVSTRNPTSFDLALEWLPRCRRIFLDLKCTNHSPELEDFLDAVRISQVPVKRLIVDFDFDHHSLQYLEDIFEDHSASIEEVIILDVCVPEELPLPNAKRLYLNNYPNSWGTSIESTQLTDLCVTMSVPGITVAGFIALLPSLLHLWVAIDENLGHSLNYTHVPTAAVYTHHNLQYLGIMLESEQIPQDLLSNFAFPALRVLEYDPIDPVMDQVQWLLTHPLLGSIKVLTLEFRPCANGGDSSEFDVTLIAILKLTRSLEELTVWCSEALFGTLLSILSNVRCLLSKERQAQSEGVALALSRLKRLNLQYPENAVDPTALRNFARLWSHPAGDISPPSLTQLSFLIERRDTDMALELRDALEREGSTCPISLMRIGFTGCRVDVAVFFVMFPPPFSDSEHRFEVLRGDGVWVPCNLRGV